MSTAPIVLACPSDYENVSAEGARALADAGFRIVLNPHDRPLTEHEVRTLGAEAVAAVVGLEEWTDTQMDALPSLRILCKQGVGVDNIDLESARARGIVVTNVPGGNAGAVSEFTVGLMIAALRNLAQGQRAANEGDWSRFPGREISALTVGLLGFGRIAQLVAQKLVAFGGTVIAHDPFPDEESARRLGVELVAREELLARSEVLSLHLPVLPQTVGTVDAGFLRSLRDGAVLVNTARGALVNEDALLAALESGELAGAALDVFSTEPLPAGHPLTRHSRVLATNHMAAESREAYGAISKANAQAIIDLVSGREPANAL
ncbi:phosphoglycerate dehydrogenase [Brachybacterium sp. NPDC056505]|uniref:phosphoglycerate dehydrogenase n=1 Tax=Brachybacterium sp. NPDC056505 TaxID=3345843 RepID=UPI003670E2A3